MAATAMFGSHICAVEAPRGTERVTCQQCMCEDGVEPMAMEGMKAWEVGRRGAPRPSRYLQIEKQ
jgi:hypothetical protein